MSAFDMTATMDGLAALITADSLVSQVYAYPVESVTVPCAVVGYPTEIEFDLTFQRGGDRVELPVWFIVGKTGTKDARDRLSVVLADATSVKDSLDGSQSFGSVRVTDASIEEVTVSGVAYLSARFDVEVLS